MFSRPIGMCTIYVSIIKRFLSNDVRRVLNTRLEPLNGIGGSQLQFAVVSKKLNALNLDLFVNNLSQCEDNGTAVLNLLANLRASKLANTCLESTHFAVVGYLLENLRIKEIVPVLMDRSKYGIFLNNFTAFAVTQTLQNEKEHIIGLPLLLKLILLDDLDSQYIQIFCIKSSLKILKNGNMNNTALGKIEEKKVRVTFLRNEKTFNLYEEIGKAILKIASKNLEDNLMDNATILGLALTRNYVELEKILNRTSTEVYEDIADLCKDILSHGNKAEFFNKIDKLKSKMSFEGKIDALLKESESKEGNSLAEKQKELLPTWQQLRKQRKLTLEKKVTQKERIENIEKMCNEINTKKELLWFFDNEDKIDLEIYNKRVFYPKRWFGKKKKPRVVDEHYVPPQIRKLH